MTDIGHNSGDASIDVLNQHKVLALRKIDRAKRQEEEALIDLYLSALFDE